METIPVRHLRTIRLKKTDNTKVIRKTKHEKENNRPIQTTKVAIHI